MSTRTIPLPLDTTPARPLWRQLLALIPGTALLFAVGLAGKGVESLGHSLRSRHIPFPQVEYVLWAILLGLAIGNAVRLPALFRPGLATYELWLKLGIVLVGAKFLLGDLLRLGGLSLILVAIELVLSLSVMTLLGRIFGLRPKLTSLLAIGSSISGVTPIMAPQGATDPP